MRRTFGLRQRMIAVVVFFMVLVFVLIQTKHGSQIENIVIDAEKSRNTILVDTMLPILRTNLAFGLIDSNRDYLDTIAKQNNSVLSIELKDPDSKVLYTYNSHMVEGEHKQIKSYRLTKTISDDATQSLLGTLSMEFSHRYYDAVLEQYYNFVLEYFGIFLIIMAGMLYVLGRLNRPFNALLEQIKAFDPKRNNYILDAAEFEGELGIIQKALVDMIARIENDHRQLNELNTTLEQRVEARTQELALEVKKVKDQEKMLIAQSRLAAMGEMMSMIAHQWRQPLATSTLMITQHKITSMLENRDRDRRDEILDTISDTMIYLSDTIDDFQTYFKPDKQKEACALQKVVERAANFSAARLKSHNIEIVVLCEKHIGIQTYFNELVQIALNLINNAIDAIAANHPERKQIRIVCEARDGAIYLHVSDTGGGIPANIIDRIFEPYFSSKGKNGTGLGLYMAKMIIERYLSGTISVANDDEGARFTIRFESLQ